MQQEQAKISFYRVNKCGFYEWGAAAPAFGDLDDSLEQLHKWANGVELSQTKIANPAGKEGGMPVYLAGIEKHGDSWIFATWNEVPATEGGVASIAMNSVVGAPEVHINGIKPNSIPGYATYFWALPQLGVLASVRFNHKVSGQQEMRAYLERFLALESEYAVEGQNEDGALSIVGYRQREGEPVMKLSARFHTSAYIKGGQRKYLLDNFTRIKKVIRRAHLSSLKVTDRTWWENFASFLHGKPAENHAFLSKQAYVELEYTPTKEELEAMMDAEDAEPIASTWDDLGFVLEKESSKPYWISKSSASDTFDLLIERENAELVKLTSLAAALQAGQAKILRLLNENA